MSQYVNWSALANVVLVGLMVGAGLPALFAVGVRALAGPVRTTTLVGVPRHSVALALASFGAVVTAIVVAVALIVSGGH